MKLQNLFVSNFLGVTSAEVSLDTPITLFCGPNGAGKSSLRDAIALALTADLGRVSLKKDAPQLVHDDADAAVCEIEDVDGDAFHVSITSAGKIADSQKGRDPDPYMPFVLDAQRFARLDATARRAFLYDLMRVKAGHEEIAKRLKAKGCDETRVARVLPLLRSGFDAASKQAKANATEAKGAWRSVTGETYGSEKAKTWRAHVPPYDKAAASGVATELKHCDVALEQWQQEVGRLHGVLERRHELGERRAGLLEQAGRVEALERKLATDEQQLADWEEDLAKTKAAAGGGPRVGLVHELAAAIAKALPAWPGKEHADSGWQELSDALSAYEAEHGPINAQAGDGKAAARLPSIQNSRDLMARSVANDRRDLDHAKAAKAELAAIDEELAKPVDAAALTEARNQVEALKAQRVDIVKRSDTLASIKAQVEAADKQTEEALKYAADVTEWDSIGEALSPNGIPAEILAEALGPINDRLTQSAQDAQWERVEITSDMQIRTGLHERPYALLSESEKWRADAMLAEAIAHLSGARLLVLDRFDVLDIPGRQELLTWLHTLADVGEIDTAILFGTLKTVPTGLPPTIAAHWIENGVVAQLKEAA